jgi:iron complex outermembrane receptor protein
VFKSTTASWVTRCAVVLVACPLLPMSAEAQEQSQTAGAGAPGTTGLEEVVVTGSRIPVIANETPPDAKIYTREQIDRSGGTTISEFLNTLPDVSLSITENGFQTLSGTTTVQLHGLPIGTTLILLNGRRVGTSGAGQLLGLTYFDLNTIPLAAVDRIELVSQGSSAVYGSDAIAGVINVILKQGYNGFAANSKYGSASAHHQEDADLTWGGRWDKGSLMLIGSYLTRTELPGYERTLTNDNNYVSDGGRNADYYMCPNQANIYSLDGNNLAGLSAPYAAVPAGYTGAPTRQEFGPTAGSLNRCSLFRYASQIQGTERAGILLTGTYDPSPTMELYGNLLFSHTEQSGYIAPPLLSGQPGFQQFTVGAGNAFNPFGEAVGVTEMLPALGRQAEDLSTNYWNFLLGLKGDLSSGWAWDIGISDSEDRTGYTQPDWNQVTLQAALNSPDPSTALNPFVAASPGSLAALQSLVTHDTVDSLGRATVVNASLRGPLLTLPAGPLRAVFGVESEHDTLFQNLFIFPGPAQRTDFHRKSYALFAEARVPIIGPPAGLETGDRLAVTLAGRHDHDDEFGSKSTPQFGAEIRPFKSLLLRASYSQAFRAPDLVDLYAASFTTNTVVTDPQRGNASQAVIDTVGGNPSLGPETGSTRTFGLVLSSQSFEGLRLAITHWAIDETDGIQQFAAQVIVDNEALFPGAVTRAANCPGSPPCPITAVTATFVNFGRLSVAGIDYQLEDQLRTGFGTFTPSVAATQTYRYSATLTPGSPATNAVSAAQDTGNWAPRWKGTVGLGWRSGEWAGSVDGRYVGRYQDYDSSAMIGNFWLVDASVRYTIGRSFASESTYLNGLYLRLGAVNLFNKQPQFSNFEFDIVGYDPSQSDIRGRFVYAQVGLRW